MPLQKAFEGIVVNFFSPQTGIDRKNWIGQNQYSAKIVPPVFYTSLQASAEYRLVFGYPVYVSHCCRTLLLEC